MKIPSSTISPVHRLNADLFSYIFNMNADMFADDGALGTSRATSQVCRTWRELLLASPLLWGKLLDFDVIGRYKVGELWADELIRRSGSGSALWIKANRALGIDDAPSPRTQLQALFLRVLAENWARTQRLGVNLRWSNFDLRRAFCNTIARPAPGLVAFDFTASVSAENISYQAIPGHFEHALFADKAPCLRVFKATLHKFDLRAPWIHRLSDMYIGHAFPLADVLDALATTTGLESLELKNVAVHPAAVQHLRRVDLPRLSRLHLFIDATTCMALLDHLQTPPPCTLTYNAPNCLTPADVAADAFTPLVRRLAQFARRYFAAHPPVHMALHRRRGVLHFSDMQPTVAFGFLALLRRRPDAPDFPPDAVHTFVTEFSRLHFPHATHIWLELSAEVPAYLWRGLLARFPAAEVMLMSIRDIGYFTVFVEILLQNAAVLPSLKTIKLRRGENFDPIRPTRQELEVIAVFEAFRLMIGRPVQVMRMRE